MLAFHVMVALVLPVARFHNIDDAGFDFLALGRLGLIFGFFRRPLIGRDKVPIDHIMPVAVHLVKRLKRYAVALFFSGNAEFLGRTLKC